MDASVLKSEKEPGEISMDSSAKKAEDRQMSEDDVKIEGVHTQIPSKGNNTLNNTLTDEAHMLDDDDWYTNMMK